MIELITLEAYAMGRDKLYPNDWTDEVKNNAIRLLGIVNEFLNELGIKEAIVSSGFRPPAINNITTNAAKKSYHMTGLAVDIKDNSKKDLANLVASRPDLLRKHGLWMEDKNHTNDWVHLDIGSRTDRPSRVFLP
jgi:uncharacterized protein YcbK (DUF882 family)